ncbi:tetratricopeptide repeat protein [Holophaga foetida]|uniref:tetratricopeptide repeat protein n=1 Tax=Holophaga foetida TaxID=35839 RepID=UPI000247370C|nr:tetratricopeptide repeat protein [Holophaga foetida]
MAIDRNKITKQAENFLASGRIERAIEEFLKLVDDRPDDFNMVNRVGDAYLQAGCVPEAIEMFKKAGIGFERGGFQAKASAVLKKAHRTAPGDVDVAARLADLYRQTNMIKEAIAIHIEVADHFTKKGLIKRALEEFAKVVELDPKNLKNKVKLADLYNKEGMKERAAGIYLEVAESLAVEQMHTEAGQILERAKAMVTTPQVFLTQSRLAVIQKDLVAAAGYLREGLTANPRCLEILDALAEVEIQAKHPESALEALAQIPQLPEKSLALCERALRELVKAGRAEEALRLYQPIGREMARRGHGDAAAHALEMGLQGHLSADAWLLLAEIAHQSGNRADQIQALKQARGEAMAQGNASQADEIAEQLGGLGVTPEQLTEAAPSRQVTFAPGPEIEPSPAFEVTEVDPVRRMQIEQLQRDAEHYLRNRITDRAQDCFQKILELDPTNRDAINRVGDIIKSTGKMTAVQMHFVKQAERLVPLGHRELAIELLDKAEALFPGSTRLYRRTLGLLDLKSAPVTDSGPTLVPVIALPAPVEESYPDHALPVFPMEELEELPALEALPEPIPPVDTPAAPDAFELPLAFQTPTQELPPLEAFEAPLMPELEAPLMPELEVQDVVGELPLPEVEPLELEPLEFLKGRELPVPEEPVSAEVDEELGSSLSDIDFQLDYGSPEEAKLEIEACLARYPRHPELLDRLEVADAALRRLGREAKPAAKPLEESDFANSFFDLTDVLGDGLIDTGEGEEMHDATHVVEKIQSVDELFNAFREGVEQQVKGDDYDTHYNLGIAYKEMMLIEPAMEEFKKAMRDPERTLECCSMLSICEQAQGNLEEAVAWLRQGIESPGFPPEDGIGLRYDLGEILLLQGNHEEALEQFHQVYEMDPDYREVAARLG